MKNLFLYVFAGISVLVLIFAFQNLSTSAQVGILFETINSLFFVILFIYALGILAGLFLGLAQSAGKKDTPGGINDLDL